MSDLSNVNHMNDIMKKLEEIENRMQTIEKMLGNINTSTANMDRHITFVERVYDVVKYPLFFILDRIPTIELQIGAPQNKQLIV